jgi:ppGpp synthetase/RelA/SpoT-type nucleotidyltranferase
MSGCATTMEGVCLGTTGRTAQPIVAFGGPRRLLSTPIIDLVGFSRPGVQSTNMTEYDNTEDVRRQFIELRPFYERLVEEVRHVLQSKIDLTDVKPVSLNGRVKEVDSLISKIGRKKYQNPLSEITDLAGVRVVCNYESDLGTISELINSNFDVYEHIDKSHDLGTDKMGYHGSHFIVALGTRYSGTRYDSIVKLKCEVQVRTVLQDAWAIISHQLVYKNEDAIPQRLRRDLNNVASLLEIAQGVFDNVRDKRFSYIKEIQQKEQNPNQFLAQAVDFDTLLAYTTWKFPPLRPSSRLTELLLRDLNIANYPTLLQIDLAVQRASAAVEAYRNENPGWFSNGTDFITKSLGFTDSQFRSKHAFGAKTRSAFVKYQNLVQKA